MAYLAFGCQQNSNKNAETKYEDIVVEKPDTRNWPSGFGYGKKAGQRLIDSLDIDVRPDGTGLPDGSGIATIGKSVYLNRCASCHGTKVSDGIYTRLFDYDRKKIHPDSITTKSGRTVGNYWPYATTLYDYINRAMPFNAPGSLTHQEVYNLTAYILYANNLIAEDYILTKTNLPKVKMPAQSLFIKDDRKGGPEVR